jgi:hypothetical protein
MIQMPFAEDNDLPQTLQLDRFDEPFASAFKLGDPLGSGLVFTPASLTVLVNVFVNFTAGATLMGVG